MDGPTGGLTRYIMLILLTATWLMAACGGADTGEEAHRPGAEHDEEMSRDAEAELQRLLDAASRQPPVIDFDAVVQLVEADSLRRAALTHPLAALNAMLVALVELHRRHDAASDAATRQNINVEAGQVHIQADLYEDRIHQILDESQHKRFHAYLQERLVAVGLPRDDFHGSDGVGTGGTPSGIHHPGHADSADSRVSTLDDRSAE